MGGCFSILRSVTEQREQSTEGRALGNKRNPKLECARGLCLSWLWLSIAAAVATHTQTSLHKDWLLAQEQNAVYMADWHLSSRLSNALQMAASTFPPSNHPSSCLSSPCEITLAMSTFRMILVCISWTLMMLNTIPCAFMDLLWWTHAQFLKIGLFPLNKKLLTIDIHWQRKISFLQWSPSLGISTALQGRSC